jgi:hypothetical protein
MVPVVDCAPAEIARHKLIATSQIELRIVQASTLRSLPEIRFAGNENNVFILDSPAALLSGTPMRIVKQKIDFPN